MNLLKPKREIPALFSCRDFYVEFAILF